MKAKRILAIVIFAMMCVSVKAQVSNSIYIGVSPIGSQRINMSFKNDENGKYKYKYKSYLNFSLAKEKQATGLGYMYEIQYSRAKFDELEIKERAHDFTPIPGDDIYTVGGSFYALQTINKGRRLQVPLYAGPGVDYINGGPFHHIVVFLGFKARVKYYITDNIGLFVAGTYKFGFGGSSKSGTLAPSTGFLDAGLVIGLD